MKEKPDREQRGKGNVIFFSVFSMMDWKFKHIYRETKNVKFRIAEILHPFYKNVILHFTSIFYDMTCTAVHKLYWMLYK